MRKIQIVTDSACDIPESLRERYDIDIMLIPITVDGEGYFERKDFSNREFYDILTKAKEVPTTAHITHLQFEEKYKECWEKGVTDIIQVTINAKGSNMFEAAGMAKEMFYKHHPDAVGKFSITIIDSKTYSLGYGYPVLQAGIMAKEGASPDTIIAYLNDWFDRVIIYFSTLTLDQLKKSGRIKGGAAFVGGVLGIRPIISIIDGETEILDKVRGNKNVAPRLISELIKRDDPHGDYLIATGSAQQENEQLLHLAKKAVKKEPLAVFELGAAITINAGPNALAICFLGDKRSK